MEAQMPTFSGPKRAFIIANRSSGSNLNTEWEEFRTSVVETFQRLGMTTTFREVEGKDVPIAIEEALGSSPDRVVAIGGDGTITSVAKALKGGSIPLGVIPRGTFNLFAKDFNIPFDIDKAIETIVHGRMDRLDIGELNGAIFLNHSSLGLHPRVVREREAIGYSSRLQKFLALGQAILRIARRFRLFRFQLRANGADKTLVTPLIFIGVGSLTFERGIARRKTLDNEGILTAAIAERTTTGRMTYLAIKELFGVRSIEEGIELIQARELTISTRKKKPITVTIDGEICKFPPPLVYRVLPGALPVMLPLESDSSASKRTND
jgi:YegS/Rv2252/BmrU family lipid kinase